MRRLFPISFAGGFAHSGWFAPIFWNLFRRISICPTHRFAHWCRSVVARRLIPHCHVFLRSLFKLGHACLPTRLVAITGLWADTREVLVSASGRPLSFSLSKPRQHSYTRSSFLATHHFVRLYLSGCSNCWYFIDCKNRQCVCATSRFLDVSPGCRPLF